MADVTLSSKAGRRTIRSLAVAVLSILGAALLQAPAGAEADVFQKAVNYVFTGSADPQPAPEIVDRAACIVVMRDPRFDRYIRYYLRRFKMDDALFDKSYRGSRVAYQLSVKGDDIIIEYLNPDKKTVTQGYRSAQIALPGEIELTRKALDIIFSDHCKPETPKTPF